MSDVAITVERLTKRYRISRGEAQAPGTALPALTRALLRPLAYLRESLRPPREDEVLWALREASFEVRAGDVLGVIGQNGSGKSTLLKILARITGPTSGEAVIRGRVGSLLEVGTGFHPELTGRENVYMAGAILGRRRREIDRNFDEIVDFAGEAVARLLDTPVKRYSSGMLVRLGFAVAAHLDCEVLLVDEVLAVGDVAFQRKCLSTMKGVAGQGRTVVFVSHDMRAVTSLCTRALLFHRGRLVEDGEVGRIEQAYLALNSAVPVGGDGDVPVNAPRPVGTREALLRRVTLLSRDGGPVRQLHLGQPFSLEVVYDVTTFIPDAGLEVGISSIDGTRVVTVTNHVARTGLPIALEPGVRAVRVDIDVTLLPGEYAVDVFVHHVGETKSTIDWVERTLRFTVLDVSADGVDRHAYFGSSVVRGFVRADARWSGPAGAEL
jgi:lipopolysaccharide transport system ATP-binding protein